MWTLEHSVECKVDRDFAWRFWTNVSNWPSVDSSLESATLDGQFQSGAKVISKPRGGEAIHGQIADVQDGSGATIIIPVPGAALRCAWRFEDSGTGRTRTRQQASIDGERAQDYVSAVAPELHKGIPAGMHKLAEHMELLPVGAALGRWFCLF
jgi:Polyketide cyclase / dehydrase and lipid transport